jgi:hypothetical protein
MRLISESSWRDEAPELYERLCSQRMTLIGAVDLLDYVDGRVEVEESMSYEERQGNGDLYALRRARATILRSLRGIDPLPRWVRDLDERVS